MTGRAGAGGEREYDTAELRFKARGREAKGIRLEEHEAIWGSFIYDFPPRWCRCQPLSASSPALRT